MNLLNKWLKDKRIFNSPFSPPKKYVHTGIAILHQIYDSWPSVSDSGIDFRFPTLFWLQRCDVCMSSAVRYSSKVQARHVYF